MSALRKIKRQQVVDERKRRSRVRQWWREAVAIGGVEYCLKAIWSEPEYRGRRNDLTKLVQQANRFQRETGLVGPERWARRYRS